MSDLSQFDTSYIVHLRVKVDGPDTDWDNIAGALTAKVNGRVLDTLAGPAKVVLAEVDEAAGWEDEG